MKTLRLIIALLLVGFALGANAQVSKRTGNDTRGKKDNKKEGEMAITDRQQSFYEVKEPHDADLQWMKVIYRSIDLRKGKNAALYYPELPNEDGANLYFIIIRLLANNQISAYEYLPDGREMFTDEYKIKVGEMFDRFGIYYTDAKGSTEKNPLYEFEDADIRGNEVLCYYVIEKWEFDTRSNQMRPRVEALCPVMVQVDDFTGETMPYPMFWVKLNDIRPYMAQQYIFTDDDNNLPRYSIDDFFKLNMYTGDIYKTKNLRNLALKQMYPENPEAYKHAQDSIEERLRSFNKDLWVPPLEVLQARAEAEEKARAEAEGELEEGEEGAEQVEGEAADGGEKTVTRTTKRGSKAKDTKSTTKKSSKKSKEKKAKVKERKPKTSTQTVNTGVRSVRNRKK